MSKDANDSIKNKALSKKTGKGLILSEMKKHSGDYLNNLLSLIEQSEKVDLIDGTSVIIDKEEASRLASMFYKDGKSANAVVDERGMLVPCSSISTKDQYLRTTTGEIPFGCIEKSTKIKGGKRDYNVGDIAEVITASAVVLKATKGNFSEKELIDFISNFKKTCYGRVIKGYYEEKLDGKTIQLITCLSKQNFKALVDFVSNNRPIPNKILGVIRGSIHYVENTPLSSKIYEMIYSANEGSNIKIVADGLSDQTGTKADLFFIVDNETKLSISLKVGDVGQFAQVSGKEIENVSSLLNSVFGCVFTEQEISDMNKISDYKQRSIELCSIVKGSYKDRFMKTIQDDKHRFSSQLYEGLKYHAMGEDSCSVVSIIGNTPTLPQSKTICFDSRFYEKLKKSQFNIILANTEKPHNAKIILELVGDHVDLDQSKLENRKFLSVYFKYKEGRIRVYLEMEKVLKEIGQVDSLLEEEKKDANV